MGHLGIALGACGLQRTLPLWCAVTAAIAPDLIKISLSLGGVGQSAYIWSHSPGGISLTALAGAGLWWWRRRRRGEAFAIAVLVLSHLAADCVTNLQPYDAGGISFGLRLYGRAWIDFALESTIVVAGWAAYASSLPRHERWRLPVLVMPIVLVLFQLVFTRVMLL
ncbi:MAG: hypothetical protein ACRENI_07175 [Gemmatimonadaceae bacterium]